MIYEADTNKLRSSGFYCLMSSNFTIDFQSIFNIPDYINDVEKHLPFRLEKIEV